MIYRARQLVAAVKNRAVDALLSLATHKIPLPPAVADKRVVFVGASVGKEWRLHLAFPGIQTLDLYQFDKTPLVQQAIEIRPDAVIIKECAAYFPLAEVEACRNLVREWVEQLRQAGISPVLATVVPVTRDHAVEEPGRQEGIVEFNDWLRLFSGKEGLPVLDLEQALRVSAQDRHLDDRLDSGDGLHLSWRAYRENLDPLIPPLLLRTFAPA